ncbi:MAG TPA: TetR/AcrR family transcriptional regulator [Acidimicrobiales bacterium]|nr:TetR/AcrR family transcriptional regulator [Acidimicrobiales bacterium]
MREIRPPSDTLSRREQIVATAATLFAERGYHGVTIEELGTAVGISGPGIYKHFASKQAVLAEMLISISSHLLAGGQREIERSASPSDALTRLINFHTEFALSRPELIRVQEHDLANLSMSEAREVRRLQRAYVELWVAILQAIDAELNALEARTRAHAVFGLLNSTPHSARANESPLAGVVLRQMARAALAIRAIER